MYNQSAMAEGPARPRRDGVDYEKKYFPDTNVVLTDRRKEYIRKFREENPGDIGSIKWAKNLWRYLISKDPQINDTVFMRWLGEHKWISTPIPDIDRIRRANAKWDQETTDDNNNANEKTPENQGINPEIAANTKPRSKPKPKVRLVLPKGKQKTAIINDEK